MSPAFRSRMPAAVAACGLLAAGIATPAAADPPQNRCELQPFGLICDGPITPDNSFVRCRITRGMLAAKGRYLPATERCWAVHLDAPDPDYGVGFPQQHL